MSVLNQDEVHRLETLLQETKDLAGRFDSAASGGDVAVLQWIKEALPTLDGPQSTLLDWKQVSKGLKGAGYQGAGLGNLDTSKPDEFAKFIIGQIITAIDTNDMIGFDRRAMGSVNRAFEGLTADSSWVGSTGERTGRKIT